MGGRSVIFNFDVVTLGLDGTRGFLASDELLLSSSGLFFVADPALPFLTFFPLQRSGGVCVVELLSSYKKKNSMENFRRNI